MEYALIAVGSAALAAVIAVRWAAVAARKDDLEGHQVGPLTETVRLYLKEVTDLRQRLVELEVDHTQVRAAVAHGIEDIDRVDKRIKATIRRAKDQLEEAGIEHPALNAEAEHFRVIDGDGGNESGLSPVQEDVGEVQSSIPGVSAAELAKVRGL